MTRRIRIVVLSALVAGLVGAGVLYAQGPGFGQGRGFGRGPGGPGVMLPLRQLDLTEAQRQQIRQLTERHRTDVRPLLERLRSAASAQQQAMNAVPVDEGRVRAAVEDLARVQADVAVQQARFQSDIFTLLTPEQQQRVQQLRAERDARQQQRRQRLQQQQQRQPA
jgi:Spy/CpxP family protein refolding chaperone